uniref:GPI mannosyltransferase 2 n=1 Tax=Romanomermis culicivorax TaxID=13658 RepID=A0A915ID70_ROMCU
MNRSMESTTRKSHNDSFCHLSMITGTPSSINIPIISCCIAFFLQLVSNFIIPDHYADAFRFSTDGEDISDVDKVVRFLFDGFSRWDSQHYFHIASYGYNLERHIAFLPLYPLFLHFGAKFLQLTTFGFLNFYSCLLIVGFAVSNLAFCFSNYVLFNYTLKKFNDKKLAIVTIYLFAFNPAFIFFHTVYTESCYFLFTIIGMSVLDSGNNYANLNFSLSSVIRSNGLLNFGYSAYEILAKIRRRRLFETFSAIFSILLFMSPFFIFQRYLFEIFCSSKPYLDICRNFDPFQYNAVQKKYWDVGFLSYYRLKNIPRFLISSPIVFLSFKSCVYFWRFDDQNWTPKILHLSFLTIYGLLYVNVEILTRFLLSASPLILWYCAFKVQYCIMNSYLLYSIYSGFFGSFASGLGKLTFSNDKHILWAIRTVYVLVFLFFNLGMWFCFTRALKFAGSSIKPVIINASVNFVSTGFIGLIFFGETHSLLWWFGICLILIGTFCLECNSSGFVLHPASSKLYLASGIQCCPASGKLPDRMAVHTSSGAGKAG